MGLHHLHSSTVMRVSSHPTQREPELEPCFGVACPRHGSCFCYGLVETSSRVAPRATCMRNGEYPGYVPASAQPPAALAPHGQREH